MRLIVTLGVTKPKYKHTYKIEDKEYKEIFSFLALQKYFNIKNEDVIIIGTSQTREKQKEYIKEYLDNFIQVDENDFEDVFAKIGQTIQSNDILDLTQSFKTLSFGAILSYSFSKGIGKNVKGIYYAQVQKNCNAGSEECEFKFQSLREYEDIIDLTREINLFISSWQVLNYSKEEEFKVIHNNLVELTKKLFINNLNIKSNLCHLKCEINRLKELKEYQYIWEHLSKLNDEIQLLKNNLDEKEYKKLFNFSKLYYEKNFLLQSLTTLFEAAQAFIESKTKNGLLCKKGYFEFEKRNNSFICKQKRKNNYKEVECKSYNIRNCLKSKLTVVRYEEEIDKDFAKYIDIDYKVLTDFSRHLAEIDELRNDSAHAFINGISNKDFKNFIQEKLEFFEKIIK